MRFPDRLAALVVIPAFNAGAFIVRTLESARESIVLHCRRRGRAVEDFLLVVVDDASTDETGSVVEKWGEETGFPVLLIRNPVNLGTSASRNRGAAAASSRYVFFLDHDDEFFAEHVDLCLSALDARTEIAFVRTRVEMMAPVHPDWVPIISSHLPITLCVRQGCHDVLGGFNEHPAVRVLRCEDVLYANLLDGFFAGATIPQVTARHHRTPGNALDRQIGRFASAPGVVGEQLNEAEAAAKPEVMASHRRQAEAVGRRIAVVLHAGKARMAGASDRERETA